jgi:hypothetical protein
MGVISETGDHGEVIYIMTYIYKYLQNKITNINMFCQKKKPNINFC